MTIMTAQSGVSTHRQSMVPDWECIHLPIYLVATLLSIRRAAGAVMITVCEDLRKYWD